MKSSFAHLAWLGVLSLIFQSSARCEATPEEQIQLLQTEIYTLDAQVSNPSMVQQRRMLQRELFEKIHRLHELKAKLSGKEVAAPTAPPVRPAQAPVVEKRPAPAPRPAVRREPEPPPRAPEPEPEIAPPLVDMPLQAGGSASMLVIYSAQELRLGAGTQQTLEEIARYLRSGEVADARREWNSYLLGEADTLQAVPNRVEALAHYVVRQAHVETDSDVSAFAAQVDSSKLKANRETLSRAQQEFETQLASRKKLQARIQESLALLREVSTQTYR